MRLESTLKGKHEAMRTAARRDANEPEIVEALRRAGCTVAFIDEPCDLLVGHAQKSYMLEVKDGSKPLSKRVLTDRERKFHATWAGQVAIVESVEEALAVVFDRVV